MVNNRRSEIKIIQKILTLSSDGARKTEILYQGNMSYTQLKSYLSYLVEKKILETVSVKNNGNNSMLYQLTNKGFDFLSDINKTLSYLK